MIKFFRRIRQQFLKENKFNQYLVYAIGEIILVVIGILIALQINNWNQDRINKIEETAIIAELHKDFKTNKKILKEFSDSNLKEMNALSNLMFLVGAPREELLKHNLDSLFFEAFSSNELAFADNTLKNILQSGRLNLLKNEKITTLLYEWNTLSEIRITRMNKLDDFVNDKFIPYIIPKISFKEMDALTNFTWTGQSKVKPDYHPLFQEVAFENYLDNSLWLHQQIQVRGEETKALLDKIILATKS